LLKYLNSFENVDLKVSPAISDREDSMDPDISSTATSINSRSCVMLIYAEYTNRITRVTANGINRKKVI